MLRFIRHDIFFVRTRISGLLGIKLAFLSPALAAIWCIGVLGIEAQVAFSPGVEIQSVTDFYGPLSSYGTWYEQAAYGRCWHPVQVEPAWRPYSVGHWEWTDCGWYWISDEPWAWACYHYGSWAFDPVYGWLWIPGTEWAPAWVVWRESPEDDYIGWAPCAPGGVALEPSLFVFIDANHFRDRLRPNRLIVNNTSLIHRTRVINNITRETRHFDGRERRIAVNRGPGVDPIRRATGARIEPRPVQQVIAQTPIPREFRRFHTPSVVQQEQQQQRWQPAPAQRGPEEQQHIYRQPALPPAPTGRQEPRIYQEPSSTAPQRSPSPVQPSPPHVRREIPMPKQPQFTTPERTPFPTPREERGSQRFRGNTDTPEQTPPAAPPKGPPAGSQEEKRHDRDDQRR